MSCECLNTDYEFVRGDTFTINAQYADISWSSGTKVITPIDITNAIIYFTCKQYKNDPDAHALFQLTVGSGITITSAVNGNFQVKIPSVDTENLACHAPYFYDCVIEVVGGNRDTVLRGKLTLLENTTDA